MENTKQANLKVLVETEVRDRYGRLISRHVQESKSLLKNFAKILRLMLSAYSTSGSAYEVTDTLPDITNTSKTVYGAHVYQATGAACFGLVPMMANAPAGVDDCGIVVGGGTGAVSRDDYALLSKIAHGSGAGQLGYGAMTVEACDGTPPDTVFRLIRTFTNNTTNSITVYEIGIYVKNNRVVNTSATIVTFCIARDVLSTPQTIPVGATLTVRYIFKVTA